MKKLTMILSTLALILTLSGCGGGGGGGGKDMEDFLETQAINNIVNYSHGTNHSKPTLLDYRDAGIDGVNFSNKDKIDHYLEYLKGDADDILVDLQSAIDHPEQLEDDDGDDIPNGVDEHPTNAKPTAKNLSIVTDQNKESNIVLEGNDKEHTLIYKYSSPSHGILARATVSRLIYTPDHGYTGNDSFLYKACESSGNDGQCSDWATVKIKIKQHININATAEYTAKSIGKGITKSSTISLGNTPKDVYLLLSNYSKNIDDFTTEIVHSAKNIAKKEMPKNQKTIASKKLKISHASNMIQRFNSRIRKPNATNKASRLSKSIVSHKKSVGDNNRFYIKQDTSVYTDATLKKVISNISTKYGSKTLNIWVSDDTIGSNCHKAKCLTQNMVDQLGNAFLKSGSDNDIYDWVTNIYGEEWGNDAQDEYNNLISANNEITILLTDIEGDNEKNGGTIGYFYSKDNYNDISGSNERVMFYADSVMFANEERGDDDSWSIDDPIPMEMISTLAHEFQHMIHFYQKTTLRQDPNDDSTKIWINEMLSETTEDAVATKFYHQGPRGVEHTDGSAGAAGNIEGRYPLFNDNNCDSIVSWSNTIKDYSKVSAFGTFLIRNYGGVKLLHDIVHNSYTDERAIMDAVHKAPDGAGKTFNDLLKEWGEAIMLSDIESPENLPTYNTGDFSEDTYHGITYELGSINFFNYDPEPATHRTMGTVSKQGNFYYKVGSGLTGNVDIDIDLNSDTEATLIVKNHQE